MILFRVMVVNSSNVAEAATLLVAITRPSYGTAHHAPPYGGRGELVGYPQNKKTAGSIAPSR